MQRAWERNPDREAWTQLLERSLEPRSPELFEPAGKVETRCPAYRGMSRGFSRCAANDLPPWEKFEDFSADEPGVATCQQCNWPSRALAKS